MKVWMCIETDRMGDGQEQMLFASRNGADAWVKVRMACRPGIWTVVWEEADNMAWNCDGFSALELLEVDVLP